MSILSIYDNPINRLGEMGVLGKFLANKIATILLPLILLANLQRGIKMLARPIET